MNENLKQMLELKKKADVLYNNALQEEHEKMVELQGTRNEKLKVLLNELFEYVEMLKEIEEKDLDVYTSVSSYLQGMHICFSLYAKCNYIYMGLYNNDGGRWGYGNHNGIIKETTIFPVEFEKCNHDFWEDLLIVVENWETIKQQIEQELIKLCNEKISKQLDYVNLQK